MKTDVHLQRDVLDELDWEPSVDAAQIGVIANDGIVTLTGHVPIYAQKHAAEVVTKRVHGVRALANEIEVRPLDVHRRDDEEMAAAVVHALTWNTRVPEDNITVAVEDGWIKLEGTVEQQFQKEEVDRIAHHLPGVRGVSNGITVTPQEAINEIKAGIEAAFRRSAVLNVRKLSVEMDGTSAILTGDVRSYGELEEAERTAWSARGVQQVQNCITVTPWGFGPAEEWGY